MFNLQVLPHRGKVLQQQLKPSLPYLIINHYPLYTVIRENPYNQLKDSSRISILGRLEVDIATKITEPFKIQTIDYVPKIRVRTITEELDFKTEVFEANTLPIIDWQEQNDRWKAILLLKITG